MHTYEDDRKLRLDCLPDGHVLLAVDSQPPQLVNSARVHAGCLEGRVHVELRTADLARHQPYDVELDLTLDRALLDGEPGGDLGGQP